MEIIAILKKRIDKGEKQVNRWKKTAAGVILLVILLQCAVFYAAAENINIPVRSSDRRTVLIDIFKNNEATSDFVREFPITLYLNQPQDEVEIHGPVVKDVYVEIPQYVQDAYEHAMYGKGTVASNGSSITALAMVSTYLTGYQYLPDELAYVFAGKADTDGERIQYAAEALGLKCQSVDKWDNLIAALNEGKCAILQLNKNSKFAEDWHFIVLKSITQDGKILVNDPSEANYEKAELKDSYAVGFDPSELKNAMAKAYVLEQNEELADVSRYEEPIGDGKRYETLELTYAEKQLLARAICLIRRDECLEGQQVLAEVLLNRMLSEKYPNQLKELVYGKDAWFRIEDLNEVSVTEEAYLAVEKAICGPYLLEEDMTDLSYTCHE